MQPVHTGEPVARSADALARPAANNMPLSEHDTQELRRLLYLKAEGIERQERLQYLRQTWKYSVWSEEDDESYTLPDPEIPLVQVAAYEDCSNPASVCLVDHVLHGYCPNVMTLESQRRTVAYYTRGE